MASNDVTANIKHKDVEKQMNYKVDQSNADSTKSYLSRLSQTLRVAQKEVNEYLTVLVEKEKSEKNGSGAKNDNKNGGHDDIDDAEDDDDESDDENDLEPSTKKSKNE